MCFRTPTERNLKIILCKQELIISINIDYLLSKMRLVCELHEVHLVSGHPGGPHDQHPHAHHQHPVFGSGGPPPGAFHHQHQGVNNNNNNNNNNNSTVKVCAGCKGKIMERFLLHALDSYWHHACLKCSYCGSTLADMGSSCFWKEGLILCKQDYAK